MEFIFENDRPIYIQLVEQIEIFIVSGKIHLGERLPSVRDFAETYKVNPNTMQKALNELEQKGLIYTQRTNGKYVTNNKEIIIKLKDELAKKRAELFLENMQNIGFSKQETIDYLKNIGGKE